MLNVLNIYILKRRSVNSIQSGDLSSQKFVIVIVFLFLLRVFFLFLPLLLSLSRSIRYISPHVALKKEALKWMVRLCVMGDEAGVKGFDIASLAIPFAIGKIRSLLYYYVNSSDPLTTTMPSQGVMFVSSENLVCAFFFFLSPPPSLSLLNPAKALLIAWAVISTQRTWRRTMNQPILWFQVQNK